MARDLSLMDLNAAALGGFDGGIIAAGAAEVTAVKCYAVEVLEDAATFTVLSGENQDGTTRNLLTTNGYAGIALPVGSIVYAPYGGFISAFTCDKLTRRFTMPGSSRKLNND